MRASIVSAGGVSVDVADDVATCHVCQLQKNEPGAPRGPHRLIPTQSRPFQTVGIDHLAKSINIKTIKISITSKITKKYHTTKQPLRRSDLLEDEVSGDVY